MSQPMSPASTDTEVEINVVVPLYNEADTLKELHRRIDKALIHRRYQVIFIDDGSKDDSWNVLCGLVDADPRVRAFRLRRNFGKATALSIGFANLNAPLVVTLDADLQDDPSEIPNLLEAIHQKADLVSGWKYRRQDPIGKTFPSRVFNFIARASTGIRLHDFNCGLKAMRREVAEQIELYGELHRFIPILAHAEGYRIAERKVVHHPREFGVSKYGWTRLIKGFLDLLTVVVLSRYLRRPAHFFGGLGLVLGSIGGGILLFLSMMKIFAGQGIGGRPLFFFGILSVLAAGQLLSIGIIGEMILRLSGRRQMATQIVKEQRGF